MAQKVNVTLVDDIDGSQANETVPFGLDGVTYEIDLSNTHAGELRRALSKFVERGRRTGGRQVAKRGGSGKATPDREESAKIRKWAQENGHGVSDRGRIPTSLIAAYKESLASAS
jgi:hypothetical protein